MRNLCLENFLLTFIILGMIFCVTSCKAVARSQFPAGFQLMKPSAGSHIYVTPLEPLPEGVDCDLIWERSHCKVTI